MVKIGKLWGDARFNSLPPHFKLVYLYLISHPSLSTLGVLEIDLERIRYDLKLETNSDVYSAIERLEKDGYLKLARANDFFAVIIRDHYLSLPRSKANIYKAIDEGRNSPYKGYLRNVYKKEDFQAHIAKTKFDPPTPEEVTEYALSLGYDINGKDFVDYYAERDWFNKKNQKVQNWKMTLKKVWCREERKLRAAPGAPKGYEYFSVTLDDGVRVYPEGWKKKKPTHRNLVYAELLKDEFEKCTKK